MELGLKGPGFGELMFEEDAISVCMLVSEGQCLWGHQNEEVASQDGGKLVGLVSLWSEAKGS